jgi:hypothetical protein
MILGALVAALAIWGMTWSKDATAIYMINGPTNASHLYSCDTPWKILQDVVQYNGPSRGIRGRWRIDRRCNMC